MKKFKISELNKLGAFALIVIVAGAGLVIWRDWILGAGVFFVIWGCGMWKRSRKLAMKEAMTSKDRVTWSEV